MLREQMADLTAFVVVAEERSFTRAAAKLGMSQSALSQIIRRLEASLGLSLLIRTTRSVALTEAGERLLETFGPALQSLDESLDSLSTIRGKPAGNIRITSVEHASTTIVAPTLARLLPEYPDLKVEVINDYRLTDIVAERFDAGIRLGEHVDRDMIAVRIGPDFDMAVVGSPAYHKARRPPQTPHDLTEHACINLRLPTSGGLWSWPFAKDGRELKVRTDGPLTSNTITMNLDMALAGLGLAYLPEDHVREHIASGRLVRVLSDWTPPTSGYHLYYPRRRQPARAFSVLVDALRYRP
jgi:LysR family transcriptional regulator, regulator of peptidoglycan recycling